MKQLTKKNAPFDWNAFLADVAGRHLSLNNLPECLREVSSSGLTAEARKHGFNVDFFRDSRDGQLLFWPLQSTAKKWQAPLANATCQYENASGKLFLGDSVKWLKSLPDECVNLVFADPPYSIKKADWDDFKSEKEYLDWCMEWIREVARILTPDGTFYICGFSEILADVKCHAASLFKGCRWLVWYYRNKANLGSDWGRSHESIVHFRKNGTVRLNVDDIRIPYNAHTLRYPSHPQAETSAFGKGKDHSSDRWQPNALGAKPKDVIELPTTCNGMGEKTPHPTQKPEALLRRLILAASHEGELVLDPFSGSGTTLVTAQQLGRFWRGCDKCEDYNKWAIQRLNHIPQRSVREWIQFDRDVEARRETIR